MASPEPLRAFLVAGEPSGDQLGAKLMEAMSRLADRPVEWSGVGGEAMAVQGLKSLFPLSDIAITDPLEITRRLPGIVRRVYQTVRAARAADPDVLVILDSPEFTHPVARRVRRQMPSVAIVNYVSPSVWAWRPGRARRMRPYVDHILALLPFEPAHHERLGGPPCTYVGHPLVERLSWIRGLEPERLAHRLGLNPERPVLAVLPGSRSNEVRRLMQPFGGAIASLQRKLGPLEVLVPLVEGVRGLFDQGLATWPVRPHVVTGEEDKFAAFRLAHAALAASGTVTLELALAGTPMVVAYRVNALAEGPLRLLIKVPTIVLPNLVLGRNVFPEFIQRDCTPEKLAESLLPLMADGPERQAQLDGLRGLERRMTLEEGTPSEAAARIVLDYAMTGPRGARP